MILRTIGSLSYTIVFGLTCFASTQAFFLKPTTSSLVRGGANHPIRSSRPTSSSSSFLRSTSSSSTSLLKMSASDIAVCFDFDGTLGDTETPAMEVAFWEVAAYLPDLPLDDSALNAFMTTFIQNNAGRAFEFMVEDINKEREDKGLSTVEEAWKVAPTDQKVLKVVDKARAKFGLNPLKEVLESKAFPNIFIMQKEETNAALAVATQPCNGVVDVCQTLTQAGTPFCIATTSPKPRVPISVKAAGLETYFPPQKIHSGESDFDPPRFKPAPDVYLKACKSENRDPINCVAVEDSGSGVGSAANAGMGVIIGYVGASHIPEAKKESHAKMLMGGEKSKDGRGAELVVEEFTNVATLISAFAADASTPREPGSYKFSPEVIKSLTGRVWLP